MGGIDKLEADQVWRVLYIVLFIAILTAFGTLALVKSCRDKRRGTPVDLSGPQPASVITGTRNSY